jgi:hypothetical protein
MLMHRTRVETIAERVGPDSFRDPRYRAIFAALLALDEAASIDELSALLDADQIEIVQSLLEDPGAIVDVQRTIDDSLAKLQVRDLEERISEIDRLLPLATDRERIDLDNERQTLILQKRESRKGSWKALRGRPLH